MNKIAHQLFALFFYYSSTFTSLISSAKFFFCSINSQVADQIQSLNRHNPNNHDYCEVSLNICYSRL